MNQCFMMLLHTCAFDFLFNIHKILNKKNRLKKKEHAGKIAISKKFKTSFETKIKIDVVAVNLIELNELIELNKLLIVV